MSNRLFPLPQAWRRLAKYLSLFCLCVFLVVGCNSTPETQTTASSTAESGGRVLIGTTLKARTLDPADTYELAGLGIIYNLSDRLYTYDLGTTELVPQLATAMPTISDDGLTYTIPLREGVTFHDGTPFNAEAMAFSLQRFMENGGKPAFLLADIVDSVAASGEYELTIALKQPFAAFPALLAFPGACAVSPSAYEIGTGQFNPNNFVGTGPYQLTAFTGDSVHLDVYKDYWGEKPVNEGVDIQIYASNPANLFNAFRTGDVDIAYQSLDPNQIKTLLEGAEQGQWQAIQAAGTNVSYMVLNVKQAPLNNKEVRQAIAAMIDRELINNRVLQAQAEPLYSLIPTSFEVYQPVFKTTYQDANISMTKDLLAKSGFSAANPLQVEVWYPSGSTTRNLVASTLKAAAERDLDGAIQFQPQAVESASFFSNIQDGIYPAALVDWYPDFLDADNYIHPFLSCSEGSQTNGCERGGAQSQGSFYYSDRMNELIDQQRQIQDPEQRQQIFAEIQALLAEDVPYIPLWQATEYAFAHNGIEGVVLNPSQNFPYWMIQK